MAEYYVSTEGNDKNYGSENSPFATLKKARNIIRKNNSDMSGDIIVHIAGGEYTLEDTLKFDERDGATNGFKIRYIGENDYQEKKIYIDKKLNPQTWKIITNAGRKKCYNIFEKLHYK